MSSCSDSEPDFDAADDVTRAMVLRVGDRIKERRNPLAVPPLATPGKSAGDSYAAVACGESSGVVAQARARLTRVEARVHATAGIANAERDSDTETFWLDELHLINNGEDSLFASDTTLARYRIGGDQYTEGYNGWAAKVERRGDTLEQIIEACHAAILDSPDDALLAMMADFYERLQKTRDWYVVAVLSGDWTAARKHRDHLGYGLAMAICDEMQGSKIRASPNFGKEKARATSDEEQAKTAAMLRGTIYKVTTQTEQDPVSFYNMATGETSLAPPSQREVEDGKAIQELTSTVVRKLEEMGQPLDDSHILATLIALPGRSAEELVANKLLDKVLTYGTATGVFHCCDEDSRQYTLGPPANDEADKKKKKRRRMAKTALKKGDIICARPWTDDLEWYELEVLRDSSLVRGDVQVKLVDSSKYAGSFCLRGNYLEYGKTFYWPGDPMPRT